MRLDGALATSNWCTRFTTAHVIHLTAAADHEPILLRWAHQEDHRCSNKKKLLWYEVMGESHQNFIAMLTQMWSNRGQACTVMELHDKHSSVAGQLQQWGIHSFGLVPKELKTLHDELDQLRSDPTRTARLMPRLK